MDITVYDQNHMPIGWCRGYGSGRVAAYHIRKGYCGFYSESSKITFDKDSRIYCYGDGSQCLVRDANKN